MKWKKKIIELFKANDTPQRIAAGLGLGVFLGIIPGTGPIAALFLAFILPINRAAILLGSLLTNTWLSIVTFLLSIKLGSAIMKVNWHDVLRNKLILPIIVGYFVVGLCLGFLSYAITLIIVTQIKHADKNRINLSR